MTEKTGYYYDIAYGNDDGQTFQSLSIHQNFLGQLILEMFSQGYHVIHVVPRNFPDVTQEKDLFMETQQMMEETDAEFKKLKLVK